MPTWPSELPCRPLAKTLQIEIEPNTVEFKPDIGRAQRSLRYTRARRPYGFEISLTGAEVAILDDFFVIPCAQGVRSFTMKDVADLTATPPTKTFTWGAPPTVRQIAPDRFIAMIQIVREN